VKLQYNDGQNTIEHLNNFKGLVNQLAKIEMKLDGELQALLLLTSLLESWETLVVTLSCSVIAGKLTVDIVTNNLLNEEVRRKERSTLMQYEANFIENYCRSENHGRNKGHDKSRGRSKSHRKLVYYCCDKPDHKKFDCQYYKRDQKVGKVKLD